MYLYAIEFLVRVMVSAVALWVAMKLTKEQGPFLLLLAAVAIAALVELIAIPYVGWFVSPAVLVVLISRWTTAEVWPDAVLIVVITWFLALVATTGLKMVLA